MGTQCGIQSLPLINAKFSLINTPIVVSVLQDHFHMPSGDIETLESIENYHVSSQR